MKKLISFLVSSILVVSTFGCQEASKTGSRTPSTTNEASQAPAKAASQTTQTTNKTPLANTPAIKTTASSTKAGDDLKTKVSQQLKEGLPGNKLEVENKEGEIILKGTAASEKQLQKAERLAKAVKGVKAVKVEAKVEPVKKP